jgi:hypothetical protein
VRDWRHGQPSRKRPAATNTPPITAQNVLPVIDDPEMRLLPWPIQTTPVRNNRAPMTRLKTTISETYAPSRRAVCVSALAEHFQGSLLLRHVAANHRSEERE